MADYLSTCRSCNAPIRWAVTRTGRRMPLDRDPSPRGNARLLLDGTSQVLAGARLEEARAAGVLLHMPHHSSCPQGRDWRRE